MEKYLVQKVTYDDRNYFTAYVLCGEDWNGFALPFFTFEEASRLCEFFDSSKKDRWIVVNLTDGLMASEAMTKHEAEIHLKELEARFTTQGYYLTSEMKKIKPVDVKLELRPVGTLVDVPSCVYDKQSDMFIVNEAIDGEEYEPVEYCGQDIHFNGHKIHVYPVGAGSWIWSVADRLN